MEATEDLERTGMKGRDNSKSQVFAPGMAEQRIEESNEIS